MDAPGATQLRVRETMLDAGGYWRPLAAVARLLEELGELAELLGVQPPDIDELAGELADLWIITTALGDQYLAHVAEPGLDEASPGTSSPLALIAAAGEIARVVNHYDGPKRPRGALPSLAASLDGFHLELRLLAKGLDVDLGGAVREKIAAIRARGDLSRFARGSYDPSTAPVLARYPAPTEERLWGAPELSGDSVERDVEAIRAPLESFVKAAAGERLEGFVIAVPTGAGEEWIHSLLDALDPDRRTRCSLSVLERELEVATRPGESAGRFLVLRPPAAQSTGA